jgi:hypothetical protein
MNHPSRILPPNFPTPATAAALGAGMILLLTASSGIASAAAVLTSTTGNVSADGKHLEQDHVLGATDRVDLEGNATASLMLGDSAIVQLCHGASLGFASNHGDGQNALNLSTGQLKASTGPRPADDPLEIHTPAAIATLLGTQVHVEVDAVTGDTVITSLDHEIRVRGVDDAADQSVVIAAGLKVTVKAGSAPGTPEAADIPSRSFSSTCLDDSRYRVAAVDAARRAYGEDAVGPIALMDVEQDLPKVSAGPAIIPNGLLGAPVTPNIQTCLSFQQCNPGGPDPVFEPGVPPSPPGGPPAGSTTVPSPPPAPPGGPPVP